MTKERLDELAGMRHLDRESFVNDGDAWRELIRLARLGLRYEQIALRQSATIEEWYELFGDHPAAPLSGAQ